MKFVWALAQKVLSHLATGFGLWQLYAVTCFLSSCCAEDLEVIHCSDKQTKIFNIWWLNSKQTVGSYDNQHFGFVFVFLGGGGLLISYHEKTEMLSLTA